MSLVSSGMSSAMSDIGIDPSTIDGDSDLEVADNSMDAEVETNEEVVDAATEDDEDDSLDPEKPEDEEKGAEPVAEEVIEEPKLTVKQFQEIETAKQNLEVERKAFHEEKQKMEVELNEKFHEKVKAHDELDSWLAHVANNDPDLFEVIKEGFQGYQNAANTPEMKALKGEQDALKNELKAIKEQFSNVNTIQKLDAEMVQLKSTLGKEAEVAGIKVDWSKIEDVWAKGLDPKKGFYAEYGEALLKASVSKAKVDAVTKKESARPQVSTAGSMGRANTTSEKDFSKSSTRDVLGYFAKQFGGKAS